MGDDSRYDDPREVIRHSPMGLRQWVAVALMIGLNALDGFDVLSSAFAAPGIAREWGVGRDALGVVLSMELVGMGFGSIVMGGAADRFGRRPTILACLVVMTLGMGLATTATSPAMLGGWRLLTGLGIGGMLAATNAVVAEISSVKGRSLALSLMVIGYPLGATVGGMIAAVLLRGGVAPCLCLWRIGHGLFPAARPCLRARDARVVSGPSPGQDTGADQPFACGLPASSCPCAAPVEPKTAGSGLLDILRPGLVGTTVLLTLGYAFHCVTFYYILKWSPKIVADFGYSQAQAASVLVWANLGGALGAGCSAC
jgi:MFS family permease